MYAQPAQLAGQMRAEPLSFVRRGRIVPGTHCGDLRWSCRLNGPGRSTLHLIAPIGKAWSQNKRLGTTLCKSAI
jgi:hypothetical protein